MNATVKDEAVKFMLIEKGYMELEETLMQWKQKAQLMRVFETVGANTVGRRVKELEEGTFLDRFYAEGKGMTDQSAKRILEGR